ncbi:MAG: molybdenum cofactor biosynthesis protein MoaE [Gemmatimonadota bacterium]
MKSPSFRPWPVVSDAMGGVVHVAVVHDPIGTAELIARVQHAGIGAVSLFLGTVRDLNDGRAVSGMEYEAYMGMADSELRAIAGEPCASDPGLVVAVEHRVGTLAIGDVSVAIACAHAHRAPAMDAARYIIDELKRRVPIWKQEHYLDGERVWIDPTAPARTPA